MKKSKILLMPILLALLSSCVAKKKFTELSASKDQLQLTYDETKERLDECLSYRDRIEVQLSEKTRELEQKARDLESNEKEMSGKNRQIDQLEKQVDYLQNTNTNLLDRLSDLSIVSKAGAESIKKSLESISQQSKYIQDLNTNIQKKDSINLALVMNLKRSLGNVNDEDVQIEVRGGVVYVSISDKLLFRTASSAINARAEAVLAKVAKVLNDHKDLNIMVEGHTDNVPIANDCVADNWDLSVKRATAVVRILTKKHGVDPGRLTAAGRGEFMPKAPNDSGSGRSINRRTEIIITPQLDQYFKLLEAPGE